jgi:3-hexulose-6-phosphate synthase
VDIVELGTPLIFRRGLSIVDEIRGLYPKLIILADLKIIDAGEHEACIAYQAGVDIVTALGVAPDETLLGVLQAAEKFQRQVMVDLMQVQDPLARSRWLYQQGCDYICVHLAHDLQKQASSPLSTLQFLREMLPQARFAVAGGIQPGTIELLAPLEPAIVIVGKAITGALHPGEVARKIKEKMAS